MGHDVFVSHSAKDKPTADAVCAVLESQGIRCWVAPRDIIPGKDWGESIIEAIKGARVMVLVFSTNANNSQQIKREVERAVSKGIPIIPLRIEDVAPTASLEYFLSTPHWLDAFKPPFEKHLQYLAQIIQQIIGGSATKVLPAPTAAHESRNKAGAAAAATSEPRVTTGQPGTTPAPPAGNRAKVIWIAAGMLVILFAVLISIPGGWFGPKPPHPGPAQPQFQAGPTLLTNAASPAVRALVVGIDDYPAEYRLTSCVRDARSIADLLTQRFQVPPENVRLLLDSAATASGVRQAFKEHLLDKIKPGDAAVFYFSGHGSLVPNWSTAAGGRLLKVFVTYPAGKRLTATDCIPRADLKTWLGQLATTNITVVIDCCYAGSMTRSLTLPDPEYRIKTINLGFGPAEKYLDAEPPEEMQIYSRNVGANIPVLWMDACLSNEVSYCGITMSRFTGALVAQLREDPRRSVAEVFPLVQMAVEQETRSLANGVQTPIFEGPADRCLVQEVAVSAAPVPSSLTSPLASTVLSPPPSVTPAALPTPIAMTPPSQQPFPLKVWIDRERYVAGDTMQVHVSAGADCYLRLYLMNAATEIQQLFPNSYMTNNFLSKNQTIEIPAPDTFTLRMGEPFGTETIVAVASSAQFTDLFRLSYSQGVFQDVGAMRPAQTMTRGITIEPVSRPAPAPVATEVSFSSVQYSVGPARPGTP
jgi:hypothetical protein